MGNCIIVQKSGSGGGSYTAGTGIDISNNTISNVFQNLASPDLNDITYNFQGYVQTPTNQPTGYASGSLIVTCRADNLSGVQMFVPYNMNKLFQRIFYTSSGNLNWGTWEELTDKVSKNGDTMTGNLTINGDSINIKNPNIELGTVNDPNEYGYGVYMLDNNDKQIGYVQSLSTSDGRQGVQITAHTDIGGDNYNSLTLAFNQAGERVLTVSNQALWRNALTAARKVVVVTSPSFSSLPQTISNSDVTANHVVVNSVLSNPNAQTGDWTVTTSSGSLTISGSISGSTTITLYLIDQ